MRNGLFSSVYLGIRPTRPLSRSRGRCNSTAGNEVLVSPSKAMLHHLPKSSWTAIRQTQNCLLLPFEQQQEPRSDNISVVYLHPLMSPISVTHRRNRPPGTRPAIHKEECRCILPSRGHKRLPRSHAGVEETRNHLSRDQIRFHSPL